MEQEPTTHAGPSSTSPSTTSSLSLPEYRRYGRQMILDGFGLPGQLKLKSTKVAVIGAGGLGCPALQYLAGAGVGEIGIFDFDRVEESNLHRQVLHTTERVGWYKSESAKAAMEAMNPYPIINAYTSPITPSNALPLLRGHSLILDCTDRSQTRYLMSDASVRLSIPLISGAAIGHGGQWSIYGGVKKEGKRRACYRCLWPKPLPRKEGEGTCEEEGVWGAVTGLVGTGMASEAIKLIVGMEDEDHKLTLISLAPSSTPFRSIRVRNPSPTCISCGPSPTITDDLEAVGYEMFCGTIPFVGEAERVDVSVLRDAMRKGGVLVDVRSEVEFGICSLPGSINRPLADLQKDPSTTLTNLLPTSPTTSTEIYMICRRGNDSLVAATLLTKLLKEQGRQDVVVRDVRGGVRAWSRDVDPEFPVY